MTSSVDMLLFGVAKALPIHLAQLVKMIEPSEGLISQEFPNTAHLRGVLVLQHLDGTGLVLANGSWWRMQDGELLEQDKNAWREHHYPEIVRGLERACADAIPHLSDEKDRLEVQVLKHILGAVARSLE